MYIPNEWHSLDCCCILFSTTFSTICHAIFFVSSAASSHFCVLTIALFNTTTTISMIFKCWCDDDDDSQSTPLSRKKKYVDCSHLHLIRWHFFGFFSLSRSLLCKHNAWCWLITLWMRYVFRIRNFSYPLNCAREFQRTKHRFFFSNRTRAHTNRQSRRRRRRPNKPIFTEILCTLHFWVFLGYYRLWLNGFISSENSTMPRTVWRSTEIFNLINVQERRSQTM